MNDLTHITSTAGHNKEFLIATGLEGGFLAGHSEEKLKLYKIISSLPNIKLVFVTGRGLESLLPILDDPTIPVPDYIICDAGATVVDTTQQPVQPLQLNIENQWPGENTVAQALAHFPGLVRQEVPQHRRCAYFCSETAITSELRKAVEELGCTLMYSENECLDILPGNAGRGTTLQNLADHLGINAGSVLVVGDSLADQPMFKHGFLGVCAEQSAGALIAMTRDQPQILHSSSNGCEAILQALEHFKLIDETTIKRHTKEIHWNGQAELVLIYHRLPYDEVIENGVLKRRRPKSPNGIIPTLMSFFSTGVEGSWIAWSIHSANEKFESHTAVDAENFPNLTAARVPLSKEDVDIFYKTFSKEAFWPIINIFWERAVFREEHWEVFCRVNRAFAQAAAREAAPGALVWLHDYNLWMVPGYLRELRPDVKIAFFHHTHFPCADIFNMVPWRRQIIASLLQCDFVAFHIPRQAENFVDVVRGAASVEIVEQVSCSPRFVAYGCATGLNQMTTAIKVGDRIIRLGAHPVGVDVNRIRTIIDRPAVQNQIAMLRDNLKDTRLIFSVERLDYTKGTLEKLLAYEKLLNAHPELHEKITMVTVCVPAAREMRIYDELQTQIEQVVGRINGQFSRINWYPLQFFFRSLPFEEVVAYYAVADLTWITPLRDGLNLVAFEYIATQGLTNGKGVLVLSEFAGAAAVLKGALLTNPYDPTDLKQTMYNAIMMPPAEAEARLRGLFEIVEHYDLKFWSRDFLEVARAIPDRINATDAECHN